MRGGQRARSFLFVVPPPHTPPQYTQIVIYVHLRLGIWLFRYYTLDPWQILSVFVPLPLGSSLEVGLQTYPVFLTF